MVRWTSLYYGHIHLLRLPELIEFHGHRREPPLSVIDFRARSSDDRFVLCTERINREASDRYGTSTCLAKHRGRRVALAALGEGMLEPDRLAPSP